MASLIASIFISRDQNKQSDTGKTCHSQRHQLCARGSDVFAVSDLPQSKEYPAYFVTEVGCLIRLAASPSSLQC